MNYWRDLGSRDWTWGLQGLVSLDEAPARGVELVSDCTSDTELAAMWALGHLAVRAGDGPSDFDG